jgi:hypothetical protein
VETSSVLSKNSGWTVQLQAVIVFITERPNIYVFFSSIGEKFIKTFIPTVYSIPLITAETQNLQKHIISISLLTREWSDPTGQNLP